MVPRRLLILPVKDVNIDMMYVNYEIDIDASEMRSFE